MTAHPEILTGVSRQEVEIIERSLDAWNRGDLDVAFEEAGPALEWMIAEENPEARTLHGIDEIRAYLADWRATVHGLRYETAEYVDAGDCIVSLGVGSGRMGGEDGPELKVGLNLVVRFADGAPVRIEEYLDTDRALDAAGVTR
jgi:ketosteroid isomerase-like protein